MAVRPSLILLPSLLCDAELWRHQINALKNMAECRVADLSRHNSIAALAESVLADAPPQFALAGISMGGYVAFEILRRAPQRVTRLCVIDTSARPDTPEQKERRRLLIVMSKTGKFKGVTPRLMPMIIHPARLQDESITKPIMAMAARIGREGFQRQQEAIMNREDSRPHLPAIRCLTQVIVGREDALTPPDIAREIAAAIPGARLDIIEKCGHLAPLEQPERVSEIMQRWMVEFFSPGTEQTETASRRTKR